MPAYLTAHISTHALVQRAASSGNLYMGGKFEFQPTPSCRGRQRGHNTGGGEHLFQPTPSCRGRLDNTGYGNLVKIISTHALVQRAACATWRRGWRHGYFNPRPRAEGGITHRFGYHHQVWISTHALVQRAASAPPGAGDAFMISTHALVQRAAESFPGRIRRNGISTHALVQRAAQSNSTGRASRTHFNPRPRAEGGISGNQIKTNRSRFQPTPSCRGRRHASLEPD